MECDVQRRDSVYNLASKAVDIGHWTGYVPYGPFDAMPSIPNDDHMEEAGATVLSERVYREAVAISVSLTVVVNPDRTGGYPHLSLAIQREMIVGFPLN